MSLAYNITDKAIVMIIDGKRHVVSRGDERFAEVRDAIRSGNLDRVPDILDVKGKLISQSNGGLYLLNGTLRCDRHVVPALLATRIVAVFREGFDITPITLFLENLMQNPSESSREELYGFIEACDLPITADGHFLAYKMVTRDFKDIYTKTMDNSIGAVVEMPRESVDADRNETCSSGLHFCSEGYLGHYGKERSSQIVIVKINPRDVVSIPTDYNNAKGRACRYEIVDAINWNDRITPNFTPEYSDDVEDYVPEYDVDDPEYDDDLPEYDSDAVDFELTSPTVSSDDPRWTVYNSEGKLIGNYQSRDQARSSAWLSSGRFVWDNQNGVVDIGVQNLPSANWTPESVVEPATATGGVKLNQKVADEIRGILNSGYSGTLVDLANHYGVSERSIRRIRDNEAWVSASDWD